ncbi:MAG: Asp23/Gls24 family envelope stress response protein [Clostridia bacterium]|nr:Asp23/Gls24 family envelope stress response protein [Clostridia bacterium]
MSEIKDILNEKQPTGGMVKISEEVVEVLADKAVREIDGVAGLTAGLLGNVADIFGKKTGAKGVDVDIKETTAAITVHVVIKFGCRIPEIAWRIQEAVKNTVESMTNLEVTKVNVYVDGVKFIEECTPENEADEQASED